MKVQYFGGRKQIPSKGMVIKNGDILDWEGPLVMGMVRIKSSASPDKETTKISDVGDTKPGEVEGMFPKAGKPGITHSGKENS